MILLQKQGDGRTGRHDNALVLCFVASLSPGNLEYMMMRRISGTDNQGPFPLNETTPITVDVALLAGAGSTVEQIRLLRALEHENPPVLVYGSTHSGIAKSDTSVNKTNELVSEVGALPTGIHLLSLYIRLPKPAVQSGTIAAAQPVEMVVQLQNIIEHGPSLVLLGGIGRLLGPGVSIASCTETTLTLQQPLASNKRIVWTAADGTTGGSTPPASADCATEALVVDALDIRTFVATLTPL